MVRDEICKGVDSAAVARALAAGGYLEHEEGRHTKYVRLPERGKTRVFVHCGDAGDGGDNDGKLARSFNMPRGVPVPGGGGVAGAAGDTPPVSGPALGPPDAPGEGARPGKPEGGHVPARPGVPAGQLKRRTLSSKTRKAAELLNQFGVRPTGSGLVIWRGHDNAPLRGAIRLLRMESWPLRVIDPECVPLGLPVMPLNIAGWAEDGRQASAARETRTGSDLLMIEKDIKGEQIRWDESVRPVDTQPGSNLPRSSFRQKPPAIFFGLAWHGEDVGPEFVAG